MQVYCTVVRSAYIFGSTMAFKIWRIKNPGLRQMCMSSFLVLPTLQYSYVHRPCLVAVALCLLPGKLCWPPAPALLVQVVWHHLALGRLWGANLDGRPAAEAHLIGRARQRAVGAKSPLLITKKIQNIFLSLAKTLLLENVLLSLVESSFHAFAHYQSVPESLEHQEAS